ncbi:DUF5819 family protein [Clavibacter michiganensis]|uniref:DUF5819 family protein n=1 Tax=Clavibacter michiganensis TaxID=28447 RepID=UPI0015E37EA6|nr:DUF5819 family protein [Clavibacter michiganensis]
MTQSTDSHPSTRTGTRGDEDGTDTLIGQHPHPGAGEGRGNAERRPASLSRAAWWGTAAALLVVIVYVATSILMVVPQTDATRAATAAARPYFGQQWNVFAPSISKTNRALEMQAQWRDDDGALVKSGWVKITNAEYVSGIGVLQPSRANKQSASMTKVYNQRFLALTPEQRRVVTDTFIRRTDTGFAPKASVALTEQLTELAPGSRGTVVSFLRYDYVIKEFATYWGTAFFGKEIERVRWRIVATRPNDFDHRLDEEQQFTPTVRTFGWRQVDDVIDPQALSVYQSIVERYGR